MRLAFVGGLTGRVADLGQEGRKGVTMAVDEWNQRGGVNGRPVELLVGDDRQDPKAAEETVLSLIGQRPDCLIGHMTSAMSLVGARIAQERKIPLISPTTTTTDLSGKDDHFFRVISTTKEYGENMAAHLRGRMALSRVAVLYDLNNKSYTETWSNHFQNAFRGAGGEVTASLTFTSGSAVQFSEIAKTLLKSRPQALVLSANAMDAAMVSQQVRKLDKDVFLAASEWASTEKILELGGDAVEGMFLNQYFDREDAHPRYVAFRADYRARYKEEPGFAAVSGYDAATLALTAIAGQKPGESLKDAILRIRTYPGLQGDFSLDDFGDAVRGCHIVRVDRGVFTIVQ